MALFSSMILYSSELSPKCFPLLLSHMFYRHILSAPHQCRDWWLTLKVSHLEVQSPGQLMHLDTQASLKCPQLSLSSLATPPPRPLTCSSSYVHSSESTHHPLRNLRAPTLNLLHFVFFSFFFQ